MDTERFTFFWRGPFSQWHASPFTRKGLRFVTAEQFMMHEKARLFGDEETAGQILRSDSPRQQKALGRKVRGFDETVWRANREQIVFAGNQAKFEQNPELRALLLATRGTTLVEASPYDRIWGIGLAEDDPRALHRATWLGLNLLGEILTRLRDSWPATGGGNAESP